MSLYIHHSTCGLDFIVTTEDEPEKDSDHQQEFQNKTVEIKDIIESLVSLEENIFDVPTFSEELDLPTEEEKLNLFSNNSNEETPKQNESTFSEFNKHPSKPNKKKKTMIKKKKEDPQECTICAKTFTTLRSFQRHTKIIHELHTVDCKECGKTFGGKDNLRTHFKAVHQKIRYPCPTCDAKYSTPKSVRDHIKRDHPLPSCLFHNLSFQTNEELQEHIQVEHLDKM